MIMNVIIIIFVLGITYAWMIRGMFSSLLHLLCVIAAGAIAFAFWEPLAMLLVNVSPERGFMSFIESIAWGVSLVVPFVFLLLVLRFTTDKLVPGNIANSKVIDYAGGGICGLATAIISCGILVLGVGSMRVPTGFMGYQPLWYSTDRAAGSGALVKADTLWIPVDTIVSKMYRHLSNGTMSTNESLGKWYPELELVGFASRVSPGDGAGRNAVSPDDFKVKATYTVGATDGSETLTDLLHDSINDEPQKYIDINSERVTKGHLAGFVIEFEPGAKERGKKGGQLVVSNGQYRLLIEDANGNTMTAFPIAAISESSEADMYGRWRFDANDIFITSVGGKSRVLMSFEYVIPTGYTPIAIYVKNVRVSTASLPDPVEYANITERDRVILSGAILKGESVSRKLDTTNMVVYDSSIQGGFIHRSFKISQMMSSQVAKRGLTLNEKNEVVDGVGTFDLKKDVGRKNVPQAKNLRVDRYAASKGQVLIRIDISEESDFGLFSEAAKGAPIDQPLLLIDSKGNEYEAIGYEYTDSKTFETRYTRGSTLTGLEDAPNLSRSRSDQKLVLLFIVTNKVMITNFAIGDLGIAEFDPPMEAIGG